MLGLRALGLCLVFLACTGTGICMERGVKRELQTLEVLLALIRQIGADVRCYKRPLPQIYADFEGRLPKEFLQLVSKGKTREAFLHLPEDPALETLFVPFFEKVGRCSADECERLVSVCSTEAERLIEERKETVASKAKVYRSLGLAGGLAAVILLI